MTTVPPTEISSNPVVKTPSEQLVNAVERSENVLHNAANDHDFDKIFAALSGGNDSSVALEVAFQSNKIELDGIFFMDTGINVTQTKEFVKSEAERRDLEFHCAGEEYALEQEKYENLVKTYGFPGQPIHEAMFRNLKDKRAQRYLKQYTNEGQKIGIISGVYMDESENRNEKIGNDPIEEKQSATWISPIYDWLTETVDEYRNVFDLRENDVTAVLHTSGDCNCGAFGNRKELRDLLAFYPEAAEEIRTLERQVAKLASHRQIPVEYALWCHGQTKDREIKAKTDPAQEALTVNENEEGIYACEGCERRTQEYKVAGQAETPWEAYLRSDTHSLTATVAAYCTECDIVVHDGRKHREEVHPDASAKPSDGDIRRIPSRNGDMGFWRITQGERSTKNPEGKICCGPFEHHNWVDHDGHNGIARRKCEDCGAFEVPYKYPDQEPDEIFPMTAAKTPEDQYTIPLKTNEAKTISIDDDQTTLGKTA